MSKTKLKKIERLRLFSMIEAERAKLLVKLCDTEEVSDISQAEICMLSRMAFVKIKKAVKLLNKMEKLT